MQSSEEEPPPIVRNYSPGSPAGFAQAELPAHMNLCPCWLLTKKNPSMCWCGAWDVIDIFNYMTIRDELIRYHLITNQLQPSWNWSSFPPHISLTDGAIMKGSSRRRSRKCDYGWRIKYLVQALGSQQGSEARKQEWFTTGFNVHRKKKSRKIKCHQRTPEFLSTICL